MASYTILAPDGRKITIDAADDATAIRGAQEWATTNPAGDSQKVSGGPSLDRLGEGIRRAHAAGDVETVKVLGAAYRKKQAEGTGRPNTLTLDVNGRKVTVDSSFLFLSKEDQDRTVDEIWGSISGQGGGPDGGSQSWASDPTSPLAQFRQQYPQYGDMSDRQLAATIHAKFYSDMPRNEFDRRVGLVPSVKKLTGKVSDLPSQRPTLGDEAMSFGRGIIEGMPVIGPTLADWRQGLDANLSAMLHGGDADRIKAGYQAADEELRGKTGGARLAGNVAGSIAALAPLGATAVGGRLLGMTGGIASRLTMGGLSGGALSGADTLARGGTWDDAMRSVATGGALGVVLPAFGAGARFVGNKTQPFVGALTNPVKESFRRTGVAFNRDIAANPAGVMNQADEAVAAANGVPLINADRGGETVRALARSVANQSPEARGVIDKVASDRFSGQAGRAVNFIRRIAGGAVDDLGYQKSIKDAAALTNEPRYRAAMQSPKADFVWSQPIADLMQSPTFRSAVQAAESRGADKAAIAGAKAVKNPFKFGADGSISIKVNPDGSRALPSLAFWDQVKRNLDGMIGTAQRSGDNALSADLTAMKQKLVGALDDKVPEYRAARAGAASYFGAEDALDAGKMFANKTRELPEANKAFNAMNPAEQAAFRVGFASEIIDKIKDARFRANVIDQAFGSPAKREMMELVFGKAKAKELEAYVRVEELADKLRGALGGSTTARQLQELGIGAGVGAGGGFLLSGGDLKGAAAGMTLGAGGKGLQFLAQRADNKVMQEVAKLLTSNNPADIQKAMFNASLSPAWMSALEGLEKVFAPAVLPLEATKNRAPVGTTVRGGNPAFSGG